MWAPDIKFDVQNWPVVILKDKKRMCHHKSDLLIDLRKCGNNFGMLWIKFCISGKISLMYMPQNTLDDKSSLVQTWANKPWSNKSLPESIRI